MRLGGVALLFTMHDYIVFQDIGFIDDGKRAISLQLNGMASASLRREPVGGGLVGVTAEMRLGMAMDSISYGCFREQLGGAF